MASAPTHIVLTGAIAAFFYRRAVPWHLWLTGAVLAVAPDLDVIGFRLGIRYGDLLGHRGLSHSLLVAAVFSGFIALILYRRGSGALTCRQVWLFFFLAMASHGFLDAFTNAGLGVAFLAPFSGKRFFFPFRPLEVSPLSVGRFLTANRLTTILANEIRWVWVPSSFVAGIAIAFRYARQPKQRAAEGTRRDPAG
jgi:inner membrane protein